MRLLAATGMWAAGAMLVATAHARTIEVVPRVATRSAPAPKLAPGSPGTIGWAIAQQEKKVRFKRAQSEGALPERDPDGTCPAEMANVDRRFCVDRWEGSLEELLEDGSTQPWPATTVLDLTKQYRAVSAPGLVPQAYISGTQAAEACRKSGKRLCEASEWRLACAGREGTIYPYGTTRVERRCNDYGRAPMYSFYPQVEKSWALVTNTDMNDPRLNLLEGTVAKTGEHPGCVNDWGLYDMVGNLHEWTADPNGTFQGGYYLDTLINGEGCAYRTTAHDIDYHDYSTGFRCCADLLPGSGLDDDE
ncbi:MAG: SUMF1/EgtB/PvdO family nonheme iron enzyme [Labilithrix sp.]|nr:SUMF1/EgtB/PvdO family nonheme iron enzyme [Labilithrix sp.]MCW5817780.1 SUMF1/EgtB/PvdO family nonheme iron enzyme [Labilithrix sp.]